MKIKQFKATPVRVPITRPATFSKRQRTAVLATIVEVQSDDGLVGLGETRGHWSAPIDGHESPLLAPGPLGNGNLLGRHVPHGNRFARTRPPRPGLDELGQRRPDTRPGVESRKRRCAPTRRARTRHRAGSRGDGAIRSRVSRILLICFATAVSLPGPPQSRKLIAPYSRAHVPKRRSRYS